MLFRSAGIVRPSLLVTTEWPLGGATSSEAADEIDWLVGLITEIRSVRAEMNVPAGAQIPLVLVGVVKGWSKLVWGVAVPAALVLLLNTACWGFVIVAFSNV